MGIPLAGQKIPEHSLSPPDPAAQRALQTARAPMAQKGLKTELMCLEFGSIKVILHAATEAMGQ